jgi:hypothetical protein
LLSRARPLLPLQLEPAHRVPKLVAGQAERGGGALVPAAFFERDAEDRRAEVSMPAVRR